MLELSPQKAVVLFAHGSRDPLWRTQIEAIAVRAQQLEPHTTVRCAYLELTEPDLPTCVAELAAQGSTHVTVSPLFLGVGKHAREDLPALMTRLITQHPQIEFILQPAVGEDARLVQLIAQIALSHA